MHCIISCTHKHSQACALNQSCKSVLTARSRDAFFKRLDLASVSDLNFSFTSGKFFILFIFTARCTQYKARFCYRKSSVRPSVRLCVRPSLTLMYCGHIDWTSSKSITRVISLGSSHLGATTTAIQSDGNIPKIRVEFGQGRCSYQKTCNISEKGQDRTKVTIDDQQKVAHAVSIGTKIIDLR